jgi:CHAD domain-containing protein
MSTSRSDWITTLMEQEEARRRRAPRPYEHWTTTRIREEIERSLKTADAYKKRAADYIKRGKPEMADEFSAGAVRQIALVDTFNAELAVRGA